MNISRRDYNYLPHHYLSRCCTCYRVEDVEGFIKDGADIWYESEQHFVHENQVDTQALVEYRKLQEAIKAAEKPVEVRIRQGYKSRGKDWSGLSGQLLGTTTLVNVNFGNKRQICEIPHRELILA